MGWWGHQLDHTHIICIIHQTDNYASTSSLNFKDWILLLTSNQQCQSTDGLLTSTSTYKWLNGKKWNRHYKVVRNFKKTCPARSTRWSLERRTVADPAERDVTCIVNMQWDRVDAWFIGVCSQKYVWCNRISVNISFSMHNTLRRHLFRLNTSLYKWQTTTNYELNVIKQSPLL